MTEIARTVVSEAALFEPDTAHALVLALDDICRTLNLPQTALRERETIAVRIIELGQQGVLDPQQLRDRILHERMSGITDGDVGQPSIVLTLRAPASR